MSPTNQCGGHAAHRVAAGADDLQRLVFGQLQQQQVAPSSADPESYSALHQQRLHLGPGRRRLAALPASAARAVSAERRSRQKTNKNTGNASSLDTVCVCVYLMI